jgi:hypothetical protein
VAASDLARIRYRALERLPRIRRRIEAWVAEKNPVELLSQLSLIICSGIEHPIQFEGRATEMRGIEFLAWLLRSRPFPKECGALTDGICSLILTALADYVRTFMVSQFSASRDIMAETAQLTKVDSALVGSESSQEARWLAESLYGPHAEWMRSAFGFDIFDAFQILDFIDSIRERKWDEHYHESTVAIERAHQMSEVPRHATDRARVRSEGVREAEHTMAQYAVHALLSGASSVWEFSQSELLEEIGGSIERDRVTAFLRRMSGGFGAAHPPSALTGFNPIYEKPILRHSGHYYLVPPWIAPTAILETLHYDLLRSRGREYDETRSRWLEREALQCLRRALPGAETYHSLRYGTGRSRNELDGLVLYDNRAILVEAKSKGLTLAAKEGDLEALEYDLRLALKDAVDQAKKARNYMVARQKAVFKDENGKTVEVISSAIRRYYVVNVVPRSNWSLLAVIAPRPGGLAASLESDYPWCVPIADLRIVCDLMEGPSELFDYMDWRARVGRNPRFVLSDESDLLGTYLQGRPDPDDPAFRDKSFVLLHDLSIAEYASSTEGPDATITKPRRRIPEPIRQMMEAIERSDQTGRTDFVTALLSFTDSALSSMSANIEQVRAMTSQDREVHTLSCRRYDGQVAVTYVASWGDPQAMEKTLRELATRYGNVETWLGIGEDLGSSPRCTAYAYREAEPPGGSMAVPPCDTL